MKALVIAGVVSGVGKTTITTGLMGAISRREIKIQPFKAGPDYIDPTYHTWATGVPSRNLDTWMLPHLAVVGLFNRAMAGKDIAVIEGVMGLYDGRSSTSDEVSTAELAKLLGSPVILVVDCQKGARSVAAIVTGYRDFDSSLNLGGVILNNIGSERHLKYCQEAIEYYTGVPVLGYFPRDDRLTLPERHLGLIPTVENSASQEYLERLIAQCESTLNIGEILRLSEQAVVPQVDTGLFPSVKQPPVARIAVAKDRPFSFYYQDSLDLLEAWGAELVYFSPISDSELPGHVSGLYLGGGFPELYAEELAANDSMRNSIRTAAQQGMTVYAECGGLMYLGESIRDLEGKDHPMTGVLAISSRIDKPHLNMGYRTVEALSDGPLLHRGEVARGHEFHWSVLAEDYTSMNAYQVTGSQRHEGFHIGNTFASYIHLHMASQLSMARRFIECCRHFGEGNFDGHTCSTGGEGARVEQ